MATTVEKNRFGQFPVIVGLPVALLVILVIISLAQDVGFWRTFGTGMLVSSAAGLVGAFLGFLFGLPRNLSGGAGRQGSAEDANVAIKEADSTSAEPENGRIAWANNNLVEVSDWLTKIIVGVGLVEFENLVEWIGKVSTAAGTAAGFSDASAQATFGVCVILASFVYGFLLSYLYARTIVALLLARAHNQVADEIERKYKEVVNEKAELESEKARLELRQAEGQRRFEAVINELPEGVKGPSAVLAALYGPPPQGFTEAIDKSRELLADPAHGSNPRLHAYLAFGLGQKYRFEHERAAPAAELKVISDEAYAAIERALAIDAGLKPWMRSLWSRDDPGFRPAEDDLTPFWDHPDERARFAVLLG